jgi:hypothetical protein
MSVTILESLENANMNLDNISRIGTAILPLIKEQLNNAVVLLEKGYSVDELVEPLLDKYGDVDSVPYKSQ